MIRTVTTFVALIAFGLITSAQADTVDSQHPVLKADAVVTDNVVRVGDLVAHAGIIARVPIFRAPDLGSTGTVSADDVIEAVRKHELIGLDTAGLTEVRVTRAARAIPMKDIEDAIIHALMVRYNLGPAKDITVTFDHEMQTIYVPPAANGVVRVTGIDYDVHSGHFSASLEFPAGATSRGRLQIYGRAQAMVDVLTVAHQIERGVTLKNTDLVIERRPKVEIARDALTDRDQVVGLSARVTLHPGRPLRTADLTKPDLVQRNETVTLVYQVPGIMLTVRGNAAEGGSEGDVISVINEQTKRTVQGVVVGAGRVVVNAGSARRAANIQSASR